MKKILFLFFVPLFLSSCEKDEPEPQVTSADFTVLIYMMAQNTLSNFSVDDIKEMMQGMKAVGDNSRLLVYIDDYSAPRLVKIEKNAAGDVAQRILWTYEEQNSTDPEVMYEVFKRAFTAFPSKSYGAVFWSHADGWLPDYDMNLTRWFGQDGSSYMNIPVMDKALERVVTLLSPDYRFKFIMFDACYMQSVEVMYQLRSYTDYFIGAPIEIPGPGAPYHKIMQPMFKEPCDVAGIAKAYYEYYTDAANYPMRNSSGQTVWYKDLGVAVSLVKSSELDSLARISAKLLPAYSLVLADYDVSKVQSFDVRGRKGYYDLGDFMKNTVSEAEYREFEAQLKRAVPYAQATDVCYSSYAGGTSFRIDNYSGVATYIPRPLEKYNVWNEYFRMFRWHQNSGWSEAGW